MKSWASRSLHVARRLQCHAHPPQRDGCRGQSASPQLCLFSGEALSLLPSLRLSTQSWVNLETEKLVMWRPLVSEDRTAALQAELKISPILCHPKLCLAGKTAACAIPRVSISNSETSLKGHTVPSSLGPSFSVMWAELWGGGRGLPVLVCLLLI